MPGLQPQLTGTLEGAKHTAAAFLNVVRSEESADVRAAGGPIPKRNGRGVGTRKKTRAKHKGL